MEKPTMEQMIEYFEGIVAQKRAMARCGMKNTKGQEVEDAIIKTYGFVINTLSRWNEEGWN